MTFLVRHAAPTSSMALPAPMNYAMPATAPAPEAMTIDFRQVFGALMRRKYWIILPFIALTALGLAAALQIQTRYTSFVQVLVDPREIQVVRPDATLRSQVPEAVSSVTENAIVLLRSTSTVTQAVERLKLYDDEEFIGRPGRFGAAPDMSLEARRSRAVSSLEKRVGARRADRSSVIEATVWSHDREKAARIANAIAAVFLETQTGAEGDTARKASQAVASRLDELGARVQQAERDVEDYKARNNLQTANGKLVGEQQLQELNSQLVLARARTSEARSKYESVRRLSVQAIERGELPDASASGVLSQLRLKYADAARLEADARTKFGARHPEMVSASAQLRDTRSQVSEELTRISRAAQSEFERARASEDSLSRSLDQLKVQSSSTGEASVRLRELERQADASRTIYASFLKRARELNEQEDLSTYNARVVSPATPPNYPSSVSRSMVAAGASIVGLLIGLVLALLTEQFDPTLRDRRQFQQASGLPVIGEMPASRQKSGVSAHVLDAPNSAAALGACRIADAFAAQADPSRMRSVMFLTVGPAVQGTETVLNAAIAAAQAEWRVLMIDADTSGHGLSGQLEQQPRLGLAEVIERRGSLQAALMHDSRSGLRILALSGADSGSMPRATPHGIQQQVLVPANAYELTFIDGGAIETASAALAFAPMVDDIVLIAGTGRSTAKDLATGIDTLRAFSHKLRGIVIA